MNSGKTIPRFTRRKLLQGASASALVGALAISADATFIEPNHPVLKRLEIRLRRLPAAFDGFTIAQLSDFHYDEHFSVVPIKKSIEIVNELKPDLVVLTGDFVTCPLFCDRREHARQAAAELADPCAAILSQLRAPKGCVAVIGNHDWNTNPERVIAILKSHGIPTLRNTSMTVEREGAHFWLCGADDAPDDGDVKDTLRGIPSNECVVMLAHEPDSADLMVPYPVDFQLSGHSHGGQIRLPLIGAPYLPALARKYPYGLYKVGSMILYTNAGLGTIGPPMRWNCPPEITLFTLRSGIGSGS